MLPLRAAVGRSGDLVAPERPVPYTAQIGELEARILALLQAQPDLELVAPEAIRLRLLADHSARTAAGIAAERYRLGLEYYHGLAPVRAAESLRAASRIYRETLQDLVAIKPYADTLFMLGVSIFDGGDAVGAHVVLKDAFAQAPTRRFRPRFFSPQVEAALSAALVDYLSSANFSRPFGDVARLSAIAARLDADALLSVVLVDAGDAPPELWLTAFRARSGQVEAELRLPLAALDSGLEPFVSRWLSCLPPRAPAAALRPPAALSLRIDTSASYALYMKQPTRRAFHSLGFVTGASGALRPGFEWHARITMDTSLSDPYRDLLRAFNSVRIVAGVGFALDRGVWHLALHPGVDMRLLGSFVATTDPDCKLFGPAHRLCDRSTIADLDSDVLVGPHVSASASLELGRRFHLRLATSISAYILPFDSSDALNTPWSAEFGLGYRF